ncbi:SRPBCC family protein [Dawidia soli]|uniref:SRPBCC family protein n=1 Tax=Dawidia soli TaxID=2782352 RepID=A0AAP2DEC2_9BACT|nr:SRPBCC family protein [Dawidia soli]MBT1690509.1 SRPBCC family protein [Dawidia soli]
MPLIELTTLIHAPIERCFNLARSIDLHKLSTEGTDEEAIDGVTSGLIGMDQQVTWRARHFGVTQTLTSKITRYEYPYYFRDEMMRGAFKTICHDHIFERSGDHTVMKDRFEFESPAGILGVIINKLILEKYLHNFLVKRNSLIKAVAEGETWKDLR